MPNQDYIAMPDNVYQEIRQFLGTRPYDQVQGIIRALDTTIKKLDSKAVIQNQEAEG